MARLSRVEIFAPDEIAIVHVMNRVVRRCFLLDADPVTGKNYDHRKAWIESQLKRMAARFGIDLVAFAILSNHFHLILRSRPDVVATWNDTEVARRWLLLCPLRKQDDGSPSEPNEFELNTIRNDAARLSLIRSRLSDISWWMRLLCQAIAQKANCEDQQCGRFWQDRFRAVRLLDETALLACAVYVDLNPIRAAMAQTLDASDFTSAQRRIESLQAVKPCVKQTTALELDSPDLLAAEPNSLPSEIVKQSDTSPQQSAPSDQFLSPLTIDELLDPTGPQPSESGSRCSDKGFFPMSIGDYLELLEWTARQSSTGEHCLAPQTAPSLLQRLALTPSAWCELVGDFAKLFCNVAGELLTMAEARSRVRHRRYRIRRQARALLTDHG